jgi:glycosyltransferase involved in cell wall biosynthesis
VGLPLGAPPREGPQARARVAELYGSPVPIDLAVLGQDPRFGGGGHALTTAFLDGARALGRDPVLLYEPHPGLDRTLAPTRVEALYQLRTARRLEAPARAARSLWVVATMAANGSAAPRSGRPYDCWVATTLDAEWAGRSPGLTPLHRALAGLSLPTLRRLQRTVLRGAGQVFATSEASSELLAEILEANVPVLPIPVDTERVVPEADERWLERLAAGPMIGFVGRADDPRKNVRALLEAFRTIRAELPNARLRLIGRPPKEPVGEAIEVTGQIDDISPPLRECSLLVLPSLQEGFGVVVAESLAAGVPVVSTPSGGPEGLLRESGGGRITSTFDATDLASACIDLLGDADAMLAARRAGRSYVVLHHSRAAFLTQLEPLLSRPGRGLATLRQ